MINDIIFTSNISLDLKQKKKYWRLKNTRYNRINLISLNFIYLKFALQC